MRNPMRAAVVGAAIIPLIVVASFGQSWQAVTAEMHGAALDEEGGMLAVGDRGVILFSPDGGNSWGLPDSRTHARLNGVALLDPMRAVIAGEENYIARSVDGGLTWEVVDPGTPASGSFRCVVPLPNPDYVLVAGDSVLLMSDDGGEHWSPVSVPDGGITAARFYTPEIGVAAVEGIGILRTIDGGENWSVVLENLSDTITAIASLDDGSYSLAATAGGEFYASPDSGARWIEGDVPPVDMSIRGVDLASGGRVVAVGRGLDQTPDGPRVARFDADRKEWEVIDVPVYTGSVAVEGVCLAETGNWLIAAASGLVMHYNALVDSAGIITNPLLFRPPYPSYNVHEIAFADHRHGLFSRILNDGALRTTDGGTTWGASAVGGVEAYGLHFLSPEYGAWFADNVSKLYVTRDQGQSVEFHNVEVNLPDAPPWPELVQVFWRDKGKTGYVLGALGGATTPRSFLYRMIDTTNRLVGMEITEEGWGILAADFSDGGFGLVATYRINESPTTIRLYRTWDTLRTLELIDQLEDQSLFNWGIRAHSFNRAFRSVLLDDTTEADSRALLMETTDGGESWHPFHTFDGPVSLSFLSDSVWIAGSSYARFWISRDAGRTWTAEQIEPVPTLYYGGFLYPSRIGKAVAAPDNRTVFLIGSNGLLLRKTFAEPLLSIGRERESALSARISVYPNPIRGQAHVGWRRLSVFSVRLYDAAGRLIAVFPVEEGNSSITIDVAALPPGPCQVVLCNAAGDWIGTGRFVKR